MSIEKFAKFIKLRQTSQRELCISLNNLTYLCKILDRLISSLVHYRRMSILFPDQFLLKTKHFEVNQDREVPIVGFFIIASKRKLSAIDEFTDDEVVEFSRLVHLIRRGMSEKLNIREVYLFQNEDSAHGFHLWMFPRHDWMEYYGRKIQSVRPIMEFAEAHHTTPKIIEEIKSAVKSMKEWLSRQDLSTLSSSNPHE